MDGSKNNLRQNTVLNFANEFRIKKKRIQDSAILKVAILTQLTMLHSAYSIKFLATRRNKPW